MLGNKVLAVWEGPAKGGYTWKCMTAERDRNKGTWFGIVRAMMDPQRWANKWMSQSLHILNTGAKGGILAEADAFDDQRAAEDDWADPSAIVFTAPGALSGNKIIPRPQNQAPPQLAELLTLAISSIRDCTGVNLELLGLVEKDQPGVVEHMRKQAGMTVLAGLFDSLRRYRKEQGRLMLWYITNFLSDGRLIRIGGPSQAQYVPLVHQGGVVEYDVIVDDTPTSPNTKERAWGVLMQMFPFIAKMAVPPQVYMELLKYSPLPETIVSKIETILQQQQTQPPPDPKMIVAQSQAALNQARAQATQSTGALDQARAGLFSAQTQKTQHDMVVGSQQVQAERERTYAETQRLALEGEEVRAKIENLRAQAMLNVAKAGATEVGGQTDQYLAILEALDSIVGWHQGALQLQQGARQLDAQERAAAAEPVAA
jgi:hypothetical protein